MTPAGPSVRLVRPRPAARSRRRAGVGTLGALLALTLVVTAHAPSVITVRRGDTLWDLARHHGTSVSALRALNALPGNGTIYAGDRLRLPGDSVQAGPAARRSGVGHRVRSGETLSHIALRYGVSQHSIAARNGLRGGRVYSGQLLTIGGARRSAALEGVPTTNAGKRIPDRVRRSVAANRQILAGRQHPSKATVRRMVAATARRHGVSPSLAVAVAYHESGFQQRVVSGVNAIGVMQVLPSTGRMISQQHGRSFDLLRAQDNITAGVLLLRQLVRTTGSTDRALAGYYQGLGSVSRRGLLPQTHHYLRSIHVLRARFPNG